MNMHKALTEYKGILIGIILSLLAQAVYDSINYAYSNSSDIQIWNLILPYLIFLFIFGLIVFAYGILKLLKNRDSVEKKAPIEFKIIVKNGGKELEVIGTDVEAGDKILKSWKENVLKQA
jgi:hypothetical protein